MEETICETVGNMSRTIHGLSCGLAYYNYKGTHFRLFSSFDEATRWMKDRDDSLILQEFNSEEKMDEVILSILKK